nr:hypothetical protein [Mitsuokella multacida]
MKKTSMFQRLPSLTASASTESRYAALLLAPVDGHDVLHVALEAEVHLPAFFDTRDDVVAELVDLVERCR